MLYPGQWGDGVSLLERLGFFLSVPKSRLCKPRPFLSVSSR